jgi:superfamily II DNA or RNA helicase
LKNDSSTLPLFSTPQLFATDPPKLRPYQSRAIQTLRERVRDGKKRILLVAPTGAGKGTMIAAIIRTSSVLVLFVCDSMELIDQCVLELARVGITNVGVIRGDDKRTNPNATVQVCSIQTLARRDKPPAGLLLVDEAHLSASDSYQKHVFDAYPNAIILGFTATPTRFDGRPLGNLYECLEVITTYENLFKEGFIISPLCYSGPAELDLSSIKTIGGDYDEVALGDVMRDVSLVGSLLEHWRKLANQYPRSRENLSLVEGPYRRTFIFAVGIQHSLDICQKFEADGVCIAHLDGKTSETERRRIMAALDTGELDAISSVAQSASCMLDQRSRWFCGARAVAEFFAHGTPAAVADAPRTLASFRCSWITPTTYLA